MDKKIAALLGAAAALTTVGGAQATTAPAAGTEPLTSYRDLLKPIPNALALLRADDERISQNPARPVQVAQYYHHHHHHHHHHHSGYYGGGGGGGVLGVLPLLVPGLVGPPQCYWTYGQPVWNGYAWVRPRVQVCQ
jgi:hypothetical protein